MVKGNVDHDCIRFGFYLNNQFPRKLKRDGDGYLIDKASCNAFTFDGRDNGKLSVMEDLFEWRNGATGQYSAGDTQFKRLLSINQGSGMCWKVCTLQVIPSTTTVVLP